jgi:acetolactate synthase-1/3 small subunit
VDVNTNTYTLQVVGSSDKNDAFIEAIDYADILELVRSGVSGLSRGEKVLKV